MRILCWLGFHRWKTTVYEVRSPGMLVIGLLNITSCVAATFPLDNSKR
jgi:hypothetical protein